MTEGVLLRFRGRRAVGTIIAGLIILSLILTVLSTIVFVSQQYDYYQQIANKMAQYHQQQASEKLVANYPGLIPNTPWSGCSSNCNMYNMSLSNLGGVGVQISAIYITSVGTGCTTPCVLTPSSSSTSYAFKQSTQFLNPGETNHAVLLYLPSTVTLPNAAPGQNTILIVTSRGNQFSFQWPFQIVLLGGQTTSAFSAGIMKIGYQCGSTCSNPGYDSKNEPGVTGGSPSGQYCHQESQSSNPTSERPQEFTGITVGGQSIGDGGDLWFVNPWITATIFCNTAYDCSGTGGTCSSSSCNDTTLYLYVNITNTGITGYTPTAGSLDLTWYGSNHIDGALIGMYYNGVFYADGASNAPIVPCATYPSCVSSSPSSHPDFFYGIFRATEVTLDTGSGGTWPPTPTGSSVMFFGSLSLSNSLENTQFVGGTELSTGLWIRYSC